MNNIKIRIGKEYIGGKTFEDYWTVKDLHKALLDIQDMNAASENNNIVNMEKFYLKIYGSYDPAITKGRSKCSCCPDNPSYDRYQNYNELLDNKAPVLVLVSHYNDFREFEVFCAYYDDASIDNDNKNRYGKIELWGTKKTFWDHIKARIFGKEMCL